MDLFGGSPKTETTVCVTFTDATTVPASPSARAISLSGRVTKSSSAPVKEMPRSHGVSHSTGATDKKALSATSSETRARTYRRSLSDKLTPSLISAGLVCGITPSSTRKQSGQPIQVLALDMPVGGAAAKPLSDFSYSSAAEAPL